MSSTPPPLPPSQKGLITSAYIFSGLTVIPLLGFVFGVVGIGLGIRLCSKGQQGHGAAAIGISAFMLFIAIPITVIAVLTLLGNQLQEIFSQITADPSYRQGH